MSSPCYCSHEVKKGAWSPEEDKKLITYILRNGYSNWQLIPKFSGLTRRSGKSCRLRWMNYLRPGLKREPISNLEEEIIIRYHKSLGNRWSAIASQLPGRTANEIRNYWNRHLRKKLLLQPIDESVFSNSVGDNAGDGEMGFGSALWPVEPENEVSYLSSSSVRNSVIKGTPIFQGMSQCTGNSDSDFSDINAFVQILRHGAEMDDTAADDGCSQKRASTDEAVESTQVWVGLRQSAETL